MVSVYRYIRERLTSTEVFDLCLWPRDMHTKDRGGILEGRQTFARSLHIISRMAEVEGRKCVLYHVKMEEKLSGRENIQGGDMTGGMSGSH